MFKKRLIQILILAIPGVAINTLLSGFSFRVLLNYSAEVSWAAAFTFSSIISATDPVAVVALLKEMGTSKQFNVLLEGESLLNDGTAAVFFIVFSQILKGEELTLLGTALNFLLLTFGGIFLGSLMCLLIVSQIKRFIRSHMQCVFLTFIGCYGTFFLAEFYFHTSGIISLVFFGVLMGHYGKSNFHPESMHLIEQVWSFLQQGLETCLFIITGILIGNLFQHNSKSTITQGDLFKALFFFILITVCRLLMIVSQL